MPNSKDFQITRPIEDRQAAIIEAQARLIEALEKHLKAEHAIERHKATADGPYNKTVLQEQSFLMQEASQEEYQARADLDALMGGEK